MKWMSDQHTHHMPEGQVAIEGRTPEGDLLGSTYGALVTPHEVRALDVQFEETNEVDSEPDHEYISSSSTLG